MREERREGLPALDLEGRRYFSVRAVKVERRANVSERQHELEETKRDDELSSTVVKGYIYTTKEEKRECVCACVSLAAAYHNISSRHVEDRSCCCEDSDGRKVARRHGAR